MHRLLIGFLVLGGAAVAQAQTPLPGDIFRAPVCRGLTNTFACARAIEGQQLRESAGAATRHGDTLVLRLAGGRALRVPDDSLGQPSLAVEAAGYSFFGRLPGLAYYLLHAQFGEGNAYILVHTATGRTHELEGSPQPSPDGRWLLIAEDGYFNQQGVFLYAVGPDSLRPTFALRPEEGDWVPSRARWQDARTVVVERREGTLEHPDSTRVIGRLLLRLTDTGWRASQE